MNSSPSRTSAPSKARSTRDPSPSPLSRFAASRISAPSASRLVVSARLLPSSAANSPGSVSAPCWPALWPISYRLLSLESFHERKAKRESDPSEIETHPGFHARRTHRLIILWQNQPPPLHVPSPGYPLYTIQPLL